MNEEEVKKLQEDLDRYRENKKESNNKIMSLLTAGKGLGENHNEYDINGCMVETLAYIPRETKNWFFPAIEKLGKEDASIETVDKITDCYAKLISELCVDEEYKDPSLWLQFNDECGSLIPIVNSILQDITSTPNEMNNFRKKQRR